ncbi:MAG: tetratricopeptide repeat protein, partial [Armatimonadota bacterium]|nr:tetratricopeptide repeat protein [Armatimonadota bacterium]
MPDTLEAIRQAVAVGDAGARERLRVAVEGRRDAVGGHLEWARVCEAAGEFGLALSEYQLALRDDAHDVAALGRLVELLEERGDLERAIQYAERLVAEVPADEQALEMLVRLLVATEAFGRVREELDRARA